ncbi:MULTISPECIES: haloacid dehalogenase [Acidianus]|uniref:Haloacid dehalogenase n=1 Tax=Candidatus Acidianus copahuensis TaxID=1160895 RepID=A0A031LMY8_9CREN|nr:MULTISPECIES: haloacid dehalogenase [Acidianus]EZQ04856.1 haloacid dehalogenase [Candidatus Acidianus copahuensis]NON62569.1 haloacid dehalogenase [Acidianus sp. RZ1]
MNTDKLVEYLENVEKKLMDRFDNKEKLLLLSRELIRVSGETISLCHRGKESEAKEKFHKAIEKAKEIQKIVSDYPELLYGDVGVSFQELAEADIVLSFYFNLDVMLPNELGIPDTYFIDGIADAIGEMRRAILEFLRKDKKEDAEKTMEKMDILYESIWKLEYPKSLVPGLRQKIDALRRIVEETRHDLFLATI